MPRCFRSRQRGPTLRARQYFLVGRLFFIGSDLLNLNHFFKWSIFLDLFLRLSCLNQRDLGDVIILVVLVPVPEPILPIRLTSLLMIGILQMFYWIIQNLFVVFHIFCLKVVVLFFFVFIDLAFFLVLRDLNNLLAF